MDYSNGTWLLALNETVYIFSTDLGRNLDPTQQ